MGNIKSKYPSLLLHYEIKRILFSDIFPKKFEIKKPEIPKPKIYDNYGRDFLVDGMVIVGLIFTVAGIVGLNDGTKGSFLSVVIGILIVILFYNSGVQNKKEKERVEENNKKEEKYYVEALAKYNNDKREFERITKIQQNPTESLLYRSNLVKEFLNKTSLNRKFTKISFNDAPSLSPELEICRLEIIIKLKNIASVVKIIKKDDSSFIPFLFIQLTNSNICIIVDVDEKKIAYSSYEYLDVYVDGDLDPFDLLDEGFDDYLRNKFHDDINIRHSEFVKNGYFVIKFTKDQITKETEKSIATILNILLYLNFSISYLEKSPDLKHVDLSNAFEFKDNIFTFS